MPIHDRSHTGAPATYRTARPATYRTTTPGTPTSTAHAMEIDRDPPRRHRPGRPDERDDAPLYDVSCAKRC